MKKYLPLLVASLALMASACTSMKPNAKTNYVAPSASVVKTHVTSAQDRSVTITRHAAKTSEDLVAAAAKAATAKERVSLLKKAVADQPPILTMVQGVEADIDALTGFLLSAQTSNDALRGEVTKLQGNLTGAQTAITVLQDQVNQQTNLLNTANTERNAAITQSAIDKANAHQFKAFIIVLAVLAVLALMFGIFRFAMFAPPLVYVTIAAPAAIGIFLFFWLGSG